MRKYLKSYYPRDFGIADDKLLKYLEISPAV